MIAVNEDIVSNFKLSVFLLRLHRTLEALAAEKAAVETNPEEIELDMDEAIGDVDGENGDGIKPFCNLKIP